jgi:cytochrome d ubiquinol oxidase subunit I
MHLFSAFMVAFGATLSAFWILVANSWQQTPAGFHIVNGRAELTSFYQAVFNPSTLPRFFHTLTAAMITGSLFVVGISALYLLRRKHADFARESLKIGLVVAFLASMAELPLGHWHAVQVAHTQPAKLAAFEGLFESQKCAPAMAFCIITSDPPKVYFPVQFRGLLSLLVYGDINKEVKGLDAFPREEWPPVELTFYSFHAMVALGMYFIGLTALGVFLWWRGKLFDNRLFLRLAVLTIPLPFLANELGWITAEVGRQPWIVYNLLKTRDAISVTVPAQQILITIILFAVIYALLFAAWLLVLRRELAKGPGHVSEVKKS